MALSSKSYEYVIEVAPSFYNVRGVFKFKGIVDIGTHMSIIKLKNGNFLVIDCAPLEDAAKEEFNALTDNGTKVEACLNTHPFHTLAIPDFHAAYPNIPQYGCPRHIRSLNTVAWAGAVNDCKVMSKWEPEVEMRIPAGSEFVAPKPEKTNHFSSVFVFHKESRTIHVDDTIMVCSNPGFFLKVFGKMKTDTMTFHPSIKDVGLYPTPEAPLQFKDWVQAIILDWDFDNICGAHLGNKIGGAKEQLQDCLAKATKFLEKLSKKNEKKNPSDVLPDDEEGKVALNIKGCECG